MHLYRTRAWGSWEGRNALGLLPHGNIGGNLVYRMGTIVADIRGSLRRSEYFYSVDNSIKRLRLEYTTNDVVVSE